MTWSMEDRIVVVTGANSGIGLATATALVRKGSRVVVTARDLIKGAEAIERIEAATGRTASAMSLDLASFASVRSFAERLADTVPRIDVLVNNAGVYISRRRITPDGFEWTMGVNHLGPFLLTCLLASNERTRPTRIVNVASEVHRNAKHDVGFTELESSGHYRGIEAYARSKLANILFTRELARRLAGTGSSAYSAHPGLVATRIAQDGDSRLASLAWKVGSRWMLSPEEGAATPVYIATEPGLERHNGGYFSDLQLVEPGAAASDDAAADRLWTASVAATGCDYCDGAS